MKLKFVLSLVLFFGFINLQGQNLETDSLYKYKFRSLKHLIKDAEGIKIRNPKKNTRWEYDHYHVNLTDSTFKFSKTKSGIVMEFTTIEEWREDSTGDCIRLISAVDKCENKIWVNYIPTDLGVWVIVYYEGDKSKYYSANMFFAYQF
jgi:hypothetical protein